MTPPTKTQLKALQTGAMRTRLDPSPRKKTDPGEGWNRQCATGCLTFLNHFHEGSHCYACEDQLAREEVEAERLELSAEGIEE